MKWRERVGILSRKRTGGHRSSPEDRALWLLSGKSDHQFEPQTGSPTVHENVCKTAPNITNNNLSFINTSAKSNNLTDVVPESPNVLSSIKPVIGPDKKSYYILLRCSEDSFTYVQPVKEEINSMDEVVNDIISSVAAAQKSGSLNNSLGNDSIQLKKPWSDRASKTYSNLKHHRIPRTPSKCTVRKLEINSPNVTSIQLNVDNNKSYLNNNYNYIDNNDNNNNSTVLDGSYAISNGMHSNDLQASVDDSSILSSKLVSYIQEDPCVINDNILEDHIECVSLPNSISLQDNKVVKSIISETILNSGNNSLPRHKQSDKIEMLPLSFTDTILVNDDTLSEVDSKHFVNSKLNDDLYEQVINSDINTTLNDCSESDQPQNCESQINISNSKQESNGFKTEYNISESEICSSDDCFLNFQCSPEHRSKPESLEFRLVAEGTNSLSEEDIVSKIKALIESDALDVGEQSKIIVVRTSTREAVIRIELSNTEDVSTSDVNVQSNEHQQSEQEHLDQLQKEKINLNYGFLQGNIGENNSNVTDNESSLMSGHEVVDVESSLMSGHEVVDVETVSTKEQTSDHIWTDSSHMLALSMEQQANDDSGIDVDQSFIPQDNSGEIVVFQQEDGTFVDQNGVRISDELMNLIASVQA